MIDFLVFVALMGFWLFAPVGWANYVLAVALVMLYLKAKPAADPLLDEVEGLRMRVEAVEQKIEEIEDDLPPPTLPDRWDELDGLQGSRDLEERP